MKTKILTVEIKHYFMVLVALALVASVSLTLLGARPAQAFPGTNGKVVFASNRTTGAGVDNPGADFEIFAVNANGTGLEQLTRNTAQDDRPAVSPDGKRIVFDSDRSGNRDVFVMNADGTGQTNLTRNELTDIDPAFSPDSKKVAFESSRDGNFDVFVMNANGSNPTNLTNNPASDTSPVFSPDGQRIAFETSRAGDSDIFLMGADGSNQADLTFGSASDFDPSFSPDGKKVAFSSNPDGNRDIFVITTDGVSRTRLTTSTSVDQEPALSPDGKRLAFTTDRFGNRDVLVLRLDAPTFTNVTDNAAIDIAADWQPLSSTFTVNSAAELSDANVGDGACEAVGPVSGQCTLRAAIQEANATLGHDTIKFDIPGTGVHTIAIGTSGLGSLPSISEQVNIDGYSQPGSSQNTLTKGTNAKLMVELDASNSGGDGLRINSSAPNTVIRGLVVNLSKFQNGIFVAGSGSRIEGNFVGTDPSGTLDLGNNRNGVQILGASNVTVGGITPATHNLISGNGDDGVQIIGLPNTRHGSSNKILGNLLGTDKTGTKDVHNNGAGVLMSESPNNAIGDGSVAGSNTIAFNGGGVNVISGSTDLNSSNGNVVARNSIFSNSGLGIDLFDVFGGTTANDVDDVDTGANGLQNFPILDSASTVSGTTTVRGLLESVPNGEFVIRFYANPPGGDEGKRFIGQKTLTLTADGQRSFTFKANTTLKAGQTVTATATNTLTGDTSEFSAPRTVKDGVAPAVKTISPVDKATGVAPGTRRRSGSSR